MPAIEKRCCKTRSKHVAYLLDVTKVAIAVESRALIYLRGGYGRNRVQESRAHFEIVSWYSKKLPESGMSYSQIGGTVPK